MRLEHLKDEYPAVPEDIHKMIEREVNIQLKDEGDKAKYKRWSKKKVAIIALAATMALGTTVFAGANLYKMYAEKEGKYGLKTGIVSDDSSVNADSYTVPEEIPTLSIKTNYLPEGMVAAEDGSNKYSYAETPNQGGFSINTIVMDEELSEDKLPVSDTYVTAAETLNINDQDAVYLERQVENDVGVSFDKKIYIAYPEYWQVLEVFVGQDVSKEEALKVAENIELQPTGETSLLSEAYTWSDMLNEEAFGESYEDLNLYYKRTASIEEMKNTHKIGEEFPVQCSASTETEESVLVNSIQAKVSDVQIFDDFEILNEEFVDPNLKLALDEDGKLAENTIQYMKAGNGIESLNETVRTEDVNQKLVYTTVEYTNAGEEELKDVLFNSCFVGLVEDENGHTFYDRALWDNDENTDYVSASTIGGFGEMDYYDIHSGERNNNYIPSIKPGETVTVHFAKIVIEDEMDKMYISLEGGAYEFSEESLATGYVDLRQ
ncbi:MAG: DUF4367 domain-containing protein [Lachnospiraceae bacterium]